MKEIAISLAICLVPFFSRAEDNASVGKEITGTVRIIRANPVTEVFFKDLKDSVVIPANSKHNQIYEACEESRKKGQPVHLQIDPVSRNVIGLPSAQTPQNTNGKEEAAPAGASSVPQGSH